MKGKQWFSINRAAAPLRYLQGLSWLSVATVVVRPRTMRSLITDLQDEAVALDVFNNAIGSISFSFEKLSAR